MSSISVEDLRFYCERIGYRTLWDMLENRICKHPLGEKHLVTIIWSMFPDFKKPGNFGRMTRTQLCNFYDKNTRARAALHCFKRIIVDLKVMDRPIKLRKISQ